MKQAFKQSKKYFFILARDMKYLEFIQKFISKVCPNNAYLFLAKAYLFLEKKTSYFSIFIYLSAFQKPIV